MATDTNSSCATSDRLLAALNRETARVLQERDR